MAEFKIAIIGAGVTGLALANLLARQGVDVTLFEQSASLTPREACLLLQPTGLACLASMGLDDEIMSYGAQIGGHVGLTARGTQVFQFEFDELGDHLFGLGIVQSVLFSLLYQQICQTKIAIRTNYIVVDARKTADGRRVVIRDAGEEAGPFDLVVDASGHGSQLSQRYGASGFSRKNMRGVISGVFTDPDQEFCTRLARHQYHADGTVISVFPVGRQFERDMSQGAVFASLQVADYPHWRAQGFDQWRAGLIKRWPDLEPPLRQFTRCDQFMFTSHNDRVLRRFFADGLVFVGTGAHATSLPFGQNINLSLVDVVMLAKFLKKAPSIAYALSHYNEARRNHVRYCQRASRLMAPLFRSTNRLTGLVRDLVAIPMCRSMWARASMLETFAGVKTGLATTIDPASWHGRYHYLPK